MIVNQSIANETGLQVPPRQNLLLIGGLVQLDGGRLTSPGSYVELGSIGGGVGTVGLSTTDEDWRLSFPDNVARADVSLSNNARINVLAGGAGSIAVTARNLTLSGGSRLRVGIDEGLGFVGAQAGDIQLDATETINLLDGSTIRNEVLPGGKGNAGTITITTGSLSLAGDARLISVTSGQGDVGSVNIIARDRVWMAVVYSVLYKTLLTVTLAVLILLRDCFLLQQGTQLILSARGQGDVGSVNINARDRVLLMAVIYSIPWNKVALVILAISTSPQSRFLLPMALN